jgi:NADPH-dependent curcumin reductase CurA
LQCHKNRWIAAWKGLVKSLAHGPEPDPEVPGNGRVAKDKKSSSALVSASSMVADVLHSPGWRHVQAASEDAISLLDPSTKSLWLAILVLVMVWMASRVYERALANRAMK